MSLKWLCIATAALFGCDQPDFSELHRLPLWTIGPEPQLILGGDPESGAPLFRITGATKIAAGFFILNAGAHELRVYNEHGELVHTSGREGSGPEEFRNPRLVGHLPSDSLFIFDKPLNRISIVCRDLRICDSWETPASLGSVIAIRGDRVLFERIQANAMTEGVSRDVHTFTIARRGATDLEFSADLRGVSRMAKRVSGPLVSMPVPFTQPAHASLVSSGLVLVDGETGDVRHVTPAGSSKVALPLSSLPVDPGQFRQVIDDLIGEASPGRQPMLRSIYDAMDPPQAPSVVRELLVDPVGLIWFRVDENSLDGPQ